MQKITPFLWFNDNAEEAVKYYKEVFHELEIRQITYYGENPMMPAGTVMTIDFTLFGNEYTALNGGPVYQLSPAFSLVVNCDTQDEIDYYWEKLGDGGKYLECAWLEDRFGLCWQIVPSNLSKLLTSGDEKRTQRVMQALLSMRKIEIAKLEEAYNSDN